MTDRELLKAYMLCVYRWRGEFDLGQDGLGDGELYHALKPLMNEIENECNKALNNIHNLGELHFTENCFPTL